MATTGAALSPEYLAANRSGSIIAAATVILILSTIFLSVRFWTRRLKDIRHGWEDFLLLPSWVFVVLACTTDYLFVRTGVAGRHIEAVMMADPNALVTSSKFIYALVWFCAFANLFSRLSVLILFLQIFRTTLTRTATWLVLAYLVILFVQQSVITIVQTIPVSYYWTQWAQHPPPGRSTIDAFLFYRIQGILNIVCDVLMMLLPVPVLIKLNQSFTRKLGLAAVFASGSLGTIASIIRTASFFTETAAWYTDPTWANAPLATWTTIECGMYLIAACLVGSRPFFVRVPSIVRNLTSSRPGMCGSNNVFSGTSQYTISQSTEKDPEVLRHQNLGGKGGIMVQSEFRVERSSDEEELRPGGCRPW